MTANVLVAFGPSIAKLSGLPEVRLVLWRFIVASAVYGLIAVSLGTYLDRREFRHAIWGGLFLSTNLLFFVAAVRRTSVANAVVISALQPVVLLVLAGPLFGERPSRSLCCWLGVAIGGVVLAMYGSGGDGVTSWSGDFLAIVGMVLFSLYFVVSKRARAEMGSLPYQLGLTLVAAIVMVPVALATGHGVLPPSGEDWWPVVFLALIPGTGHLLQNYAHAHVSLSLMGLINLLFMVLVPFYAWWLLGETLGGLQAAGIGLVIATLAGVVTRPTEDSSSTA